ncbi:MAG TPA: YggS family pyridoxal phosphate-dependent enzyme [Herpetosiphonaceae bacterium]
MTIHPSVGLAAVNSNIKAACAKVGRASDSVTLIAASKTVPPDVLEQAIQAGHRVYGENRVQEAWAKWPELRARYPEVELHLIGSLQANKAAQAVALFDVIHALDRPSLCEALAQQCARQGRRPRLLVQVNTGCEAQKSGILPDDADTFVKSCRETYELDVVGLMCIPPVNQPPESHFKLLSDIAERNGLPVLSMGMSADYALAVAYGATYVRVGSAIFGARPLPVVESAS